nr:hypothetical protein [Tanacetum cinerariifolium]
MTIVLRYVNKSGLVKESLVGVVHVKETFFSYLKASIDSYFANNNLSLKQLRGQGYDGASNMCGEFNVARKHLGVVDFFDKLILVTNVVCASCKRKDILIDSEKERVEKAMVMVKLKLKPEGGLCNMDGTGVCIGGFRDIHEFLPRIDIVADDEAQAIVADKPKKIRKNRKAADGASGSGLPPKKLKEDHGASGDVDASTIACWVEPSSSPQARLLVHIEGIDIVADDEAQAIVADKPKKVRKKRKAADGASGSGLPPKKLKEDHGASGDVGASTVGKFLAALQGLLDSSTLAVEIGVTAAATVPFVTSSVTPTPEREDGRYAISITGPNMQTRPSAERSSMPHPPILNAAVATTIIADATSAPAPRPGTESGSHSIFRDSASTGEANQDVVGPSHPAGTKISTVSFFVSHDVDSETLHQTYIIEWNLRSMNYEQLFVRFNVGAARQTYLSSKVRLRLEHELRGRKKFEDKCAMMVGWLKERDAEIANLKARLSLKEDEAAEAIRLRGQIATVEAAEAVGLLSCDELSIKSSYLEFKKDKLVDQVSKLISGCTSQDEELYPRCLTTIAGRRWILSRGLRLVVMKCLQSPEYLAALGGVIARTIDNGMHGGLVANIDHENARRGLTNVAAYDPSAKANYISDVSTLRAMNFPLLAQLESHKDASIANIMGLLYLEGPGAEAPETSQLQPSPEQLMLPIHPNARVQRLKGNVASWQLSISDALTSIVPPVSAVEHEASGTGPSTEVPPPSKIVFENEELETTPEHTTAS